jgi:uncharacterized repeat protein (TIGR01451 family)
MKIAAYLLRGLFGVLLFVAMAAPFSGVSADGQAVDPDDCLPKYPPPPVVKLKVRVPACSEPGGAITYRICVENCSTAEAHHVTVKNALPGNAKFVKADPEPSQKAPELQWNLGTVGGGAVREIILVLQPTNKEDVKNCARVIFEHGLCVVTRQTGFGGAGGMGGPDGTRPPIITTVPPDMPRAEGVPMLDLQVVGPKDQYTNLATKYDIVVTNKGKTKAANLQVNARVPAKFKELKASKPGIIVDDDVAWNLGDLEPGMSRAVNLTVKATEQGEFCIKVNAVADYATKKEMEYCTRFKGVSALSVERYDSEDPIFVGQKTSYPVVIRSLGSAPVTNVRLRAFIPEEMKLERANSAYDPIPAAKAGKAGQWIEFKTLPKIDVDSNARYEIFVEAVHGGVTYFQIEVMADQLDPTRWVIEQELTTIADDRDKLDIK